MAVSAWVRDAGWLLGASVGSAPLNLATSVLLARWLSPADHGEVLAVGAIVATSATLAQGGMVSALVDAVRRQRVPPGVAWSRAARDVAPLGVLFALCAAALAPDTSRTAAGLWLVALIALQLGSGVDRAEGRFRESAATQAAASLARLVGTTVALGTDATASRAIAGSAVGAGIAAVAAHRRVRPAAPGAYGEAAPMRAFARDAFLWTAGALLHERLDVLLVAALAGPEDVAIYGVATAVGARTRVVGLAAGGALHPHLAAMGAAEARAVGARALRGNALVAVGLAALVAMAAPAVPWIWGPAYAGSVWVVWVLLPGSVLASLVTLAGRVLQALDRQRVVVAAQFASLAVGLAATGLLVPGYGSLGAAAGSTIGAAAGAVALWAGWPPRDG